MGGEVMNGARPLDGMRVVVFVGEGVEDLEYWVTVMRLREAGAEVVSAGVSLATVPGKNGLAVTAGTLVEGPGRGRGGWRRHPRRLDAGQAAPLPRGDRTGARRA